MGGGAHARARSLTSSPQVFYETLVHGSTENATRSFRVSCDCRWEPKEDEDGRRPGVVSYAAPEAAPSEVEESKGGEAPRGSTPGESPLTVRCSSCGGTVLNEPESVRVHQEWHLLTAAAALVSASDGARD